MALISDSAAAEVREAFGAVGTAMITPFSEDGTIDYAVVESTAAHLVDLGNDQLVVSGTTGESPTTSDEEKTRLLEVVVGAVGDRARIIAGVGTNDTAHSVELARAAAAAGAHGLLVVTPYYSKPPQAAIAAHMRTVADATELPVMLYDIPGRSGVPISTETLLELGEHPRILAVKDAKGDLAASARVMWESPLAYYSGEDALNLPLMACGAAGIVSVVGHVSADRFASMVAAVEGNDLDSARRIAAELAPLVDAVMNHMPGVVAVKAALELQGVIPTRATRMPLLPASDEQVEHVRAQLKRSGYLQ